VINNKPDVFIVGAPKCGTTAMAHYLGGHPDIFMARKEMHAFGSDLRFSPHFYRRDQNAYLEEFKNRNGCRRAVDASVWYLYSKEAAAEIKAFNPEARVIIMLREPAEMLHSLYYQFRFDGNEHLSTFEQALDAEDDRHDGRRIGRQAYLAQGLFYREAACYSEQVQRYFKVFGRERVRVILYDDFAADVRGCHRGTLEFLGIDAARMPADFKVINPAKRVKSPALRAVMSDPLVRSAMLALRPWVPGAIFRMMQIIDARLRRSNTRIERRAPLDPELHAGLKLQFAPEVQRLSRLLDRDLTHWTRPAPGTAGRIARPAAGPDEHTYSQPSQPTLA
jgi:hypothetical protein